MMMMMTTMKRLFTTLRTRRLPHSFGRLLRLRAAFAMIVGLFAIAGPTACIRNDIPYPVVELQITAVEGEGFTASIDATQRLVTLNLDETTDIRNVRIDRIAATEGAAVSCQTPLTCDLRTPLYVTLSLYQDYLWTIQARQTIDRQFQVTGQVGAAEIDAQNRIARAYVGPNVDLEHVQVTRLKLGPEGITTYSPTLDELADADFRSPRMIDVTAFGRTERWWLIVGQTESKIALGAVDLWSNTATVTATVTAEEYAAGVQLQYRVKGTETWIDTADPTYDAGVCTARIVPTWNASQNPNGLTVHTPDATRGLFAATDYEIRLVVGGEQSYLYEYTTAAGDTIPGGDMEGDLSCFSIDNSASTMMWGSGNNNFAKTLCNAATFNGMGGSQCAKLTAGEPISGALGAGNLFTGIFTFDLWSQSGTVGFGQKYTYTARPRSLKFKYHATVGTVNANKWTTIIQKGEQDISTVYVAIVDWSARHNVTSGTGSAPTGVWDPSAQKTLDGSGAIIAYGIFDINATTPGDAMVEGEIPLRYYDTASAAPQGSYTLVIACSTSKYGDYMNGCTTNVLYVDDFAWSY